MQKNNAKSQATLPNSILPHLLKGLERLAKVAFDQGQVKACKALIPRVGELIAKNVSEHRTRLNYDDAIACARALTVQAEWLKGIDPIPTNLEPVRDYLFAFAEGRKATIVRDPQATETPVTASQATEAIGAGVAEPTAVAVEPTAGTTAPNSVTA